MTIALRASGARGEGLISSKSRGRWAVTAQGQSAAEPQRPVGPPL